MILSRLTLNLESRAVRRDVADPYQMHSTFMRLVDSGAPRPLWRLERYQVGQPPIVLLQTESMPEVAAFHEYDPDYLLEHESRANRLLQNLEIGDRLNFRIRANPTVTRDGKRHGLVRFEEQVGWLERQINASGALADAIVPSESRRDVFRKRAGGKPVVLFGVTFDGSLEVTDPVLLRAAVRSGVGHGRSFGFGLITLAR